MPTLGRRFRMLSSLIFLSLGFFSTAQLEDQPSPESEALDYKIERIYLPSGFDDNDEVEVIIHGQFPNACWKVDTVEKTEIKGGFDFKMKARKWKAFCADIMTPFTKKVRVGYLKKGSYFILNDGKNEGVLEVRAAQFNTKDDYKYANVESVKVRYDFNKETGKMENRYLVLKGEFPNACYRLAKNPPVDLLRESAEGLIEVLPVIELDKNSSQNCTKPVDFEIPVSIPGYLSGKYLVYVRVESTENENSIAKFIQIQSTN